MQWTRGGHIYCHHSVPRSQCDVTQESTFPTHLKDMDVVGLTGTSLDKVLRPRLQAGDKWVCGRLTRIPEKKT